MCGDHHRLSEQEIHLSDCSDFRGQLSIPLTQDGHYFQGWDVSHIQPANNIPQDTSTPGYNCVAPPADLPHDSVIHGTLGALNYQITAEQDTLAQPPDDNQWQICNWYWGGHIPAGNDTEGAPGSMNYNKGTYNIETTNGPFVPGTLMAFQDMDGIESALLTFKDCNGNTVDPAGFDTLMLSSLYSSATQPIASSQYVGGTPPAWEFKSRSPTGVPNVTIGLLLNAPNICSIRIVGPTSGISGGVTTFFAAPPTKTLTVSTTLVGPPASYSADVPITATCTFGDEEVDITGALDPQPPQASSTSSAAPGSVSFGRLPVGTQCTIGTGALPPPANGFAWSPAPDPVAITISANDADNEVTLALKQASGGGAGGVTAVPTLQEWGLLTLLGLLGWLGARRLKPRRG